MLNFNAITQTTITIGTGTTTSFYAPVYISTTTSSYYYSDHISLFTAAEIGNSGTIESLAWEKADATGYIANDATFNIYMKHTSASSVATTSGTYDTELAGATLVYSSTTQNLNTAAGWQLFTLSSPFLYNGTDNLMIFVEWYRPSAATANNPLWYYTLATGFGSTWSNSTTPPSISYGSGYRPNIQITFSPTAADDAGVMSVDNPVSPASIGLNNVEVTIRNFGTNDITSVDINWEFNGILQTPYNWSGTLTPGTNDGPILLGSGNFINGSNHVKAWTSNPNAVADSYNMNDTTEIDILACNLFSGTYTVGGVTPDFNTISEAITAISNCGVSGPVTFNIRPGTYNEQLKIQEIPNASTINTITFQSETGINSDVIVDWPSSTSATDNFTLQFDGADYITFQSLTIQRSGTSTYAGVVVFENGANYDQLIGNVLIGQLYSGTSTNYTVIYSPTTIDNFITVMNNEIIGGGYAIHFDGLSSTQEAGLVFSGNNVHDWSYYGIRLEYAPNAIVQGNDFVANSTTPYTTNYGIYMYYCDSSIVVDKNKVEMWGTTSNYGLYLYYCDGILGNEGRTTNNFISQLSSTTGIVYGIYPYYSNHQHIYYNSINITSGSLTTARGIYATSASTGTYGNIAIQNNNIVNTGGGLAIEISSAAVTIGYVSKCNFNNLYTSGTVLGNYGGTAAADLAAWQTASSFDAFSVSLNPTFTSPSDLHTTSIGLNGVGTPILTVSEDIDGEPRDAATPDIGADEFTPIPVDAGVYAYNSPLSPAVPGPNNVEVSIRNFGTSTITSVDIEWEFNGVPQTPFNWTGSLAPANNDGPIIIGSANFITGINSIKAWTHNPNSTPDGNNINDTILVDILSCTPLNGVYTLGTVASDYLTFADAINDLTTCGVSGPVVFDIVSGTYTEQIKVTEVPNSSLTNTITFQSQSGLNTDVVIDWPASTVAADNFTLQFDGADYIIFQNVTIQRSGAGTYAGVVVLENEAHDDQLLNNVIIGQLYAGTSTNYTVIYSPTTIDTNITVANNEIIGGGYAIHFDGLSTTQESGLVFSGNNVHDWSYYGIRLEYTPSAIVQGNSFVSNSTSPYSTNYGIYMYYCDGDILVDKNKVEMWSTGSNYGLYLYYCDGTFGNEGLTSSNFISQLNTTTGTIYGIYPYYSNYQNIYHNSIHITAGSLTAGRGIYCSSASTGAYGNIAIQNNNIVNSGGGLAIEITSAAVTLGYVSKCNYNNLYTTGTVLGNYGGTTQANLAAWQLASAFDSYSVSVDPIFTSTSDLHTFSNSINNLGTPILSVTDDIDGELRDVATPDIGADEFTPSPIDLGAYEFVSPVLNGCFSANETIILSIYNFGTADIDFSVNPATVDVVVSGVNPVVFPTVNVSTGVLLSGDTMQIVISTNYDMSLAGTYNFDATATVTGDGNIVNNDLSTYTINVFSISTFPYVETFETFTTGAPGTFANGWTADPMSGYGWQIDNGGTGSVDTGPDMDHTTGTGSGIYLYTEASNGVLGDSATLVSPCMDLSSLSVPTLKFWYHMYGSTIDHLAVEVLDGGTWYEIYTIYGQQQTSTTDVWKISTVSLSGHPNATKLRFVGVRGSSYYGDIAIDDIQISEAPNNDLAVINWVAPVGGCGMTSTENVTIDIANYGQNAQSNVPFSYSIDGGTTWVTNEIIAGPINPGDTIQYTFTAQADFSVSQLYNCMASTMDPLDDYHLNDTVFFDLNVTSSIVAPFTENLETFVTGTPGTFQNGWTMEATSTYQWQVDAGGTPSTNTGPTVDHTLGTAAGKYVFTEASSGTVGDETYLISPCLDLSALTAPQLSFWYHMYGSTIDKLAIDVFDGSTWTEIFALVGAQQTLQSDPYEQATVSLLGYGTVQKVRFRAIRSTDYYGDIAIDDINIDQAPDFDMAITSWVNPSTGCALTANEDITIEVLNAGALPQDSIPVSYSIDGGTTFIGPEYIYGPIASGATVIYTFAQQADMSAGAVYDCIAFIDTVDSNSSNNSVSISITNSPLITTYPYYQDFEGNIDWTAGGTGSTWQLGTPAGTTIIGAASGVNSWMTGLSTNYNNNDNSWVIGPCFDFTSLVAPIFEMDAWWNSENSWDGAALQFSLDGGNTWTHVGNYLDPNNWYTDNTVSGLTFSGSQEGWTGVGPGDWVKVKHELTGLGGLSDVKLRIAFGSDGSVNTYDGFAFDNILIYDTPEFDMTPTAWVAPSTGCLTSNESITVTFTNEGIMAQDTVLVSYSIDGGLNFITPEQMIQLINPGSSFDYTFTTPADFSNGGTYNCIVVVADPNDMNNFNDTLLYTITNNFINILPYTEDFQTATSGTPGVLDNGWTTSSNSTFLWFVNNGTTATASTGPDFDHTLGTLSGKYVYTESDNGITGDTAFLYVPCTDLVTYTSPSMSFWYHMYGANITSLSIDVYDGVWVNDIYTIVGQQQATSTDPWLQATVDLLPYINATEIRYRVIKGAGNLNDIALDDINLFDMTVDVGISELSGPISACSFSMPSHLVLKVNNYGNATINLGDTIPIGMEVNGGAAVVEPFILTANLNPSSSTFFVSAGTFDFTVAGTYDVVAYTIMSGDVDNLNDTIFGTIINYGNTFLDLGPNINTSQPDTVILDAGVYASYLWQDSTTLQTFNVNIEGWYYVTVTNAFGCTSSDSIYVGTLISVDQISANQNSVSIYPNPSSGIFTIEANNYMVNDWMIEIIDVQGQLIYQNKVDNESSFIRNIDISEFAQGLYYVRIKCFDKTWIEKLIIK